MTELQMERTAVMTHLTMAQQILATLSGDGGASDGATSSDAAAD